ncbi:MAG: ribosomal RNA small subunit methyltransferase A [Anaerolineae bacterium]|nr:ribosomal RNA small subunit methyltransferase A [Anaerolineae bacterium]
MHIRDTLEGFGLAPRKSLGQNFMIEPASIRRVADAAGIEPGDALLEIGPGLGALTDELAVRARRIVAVEVDAGFVPILMARYAGNPCVEIVQGDILEEDVAALMGPDAASYLAISNLPYSITSAALRFLLENPCPPRRIVFTMQLEVAQRVTASAGEMSLLAVSVQFYGRATLVARLKAGNFYPRPEVESAILRIDPHPVPLLPREDAGPFFRAVRAGFSQKRKQIKNALAGGLNRPVEEMASWLERAGIAPTRRAETLSLDDWLRLYRDRTD